MGKTRVVVPRDMPLDKLTNWTRMYELHNEEVITSETHELEMYSNWGYKVLPVEVGKFRTNDPWEFLNGVKPLDPVKIQYMHKGSSRGKVVVVAAQSLRFTMRPKKVEQVETTTPPDPVMAEEVLYSVNMTVMVRGRNMVDALNRCYPAAGNVTTASVTEVEAVKNGSGHDQDKEALDADPE